MSTPNSDTTTVVVLQMHSSHCKNKGVTAALKRCHIRTIVSVKLRKSVLDMTTNDATIVFAVHALLIDVFPL